MNSTVQNVIQWKNSNKKTIGENNKQEDCVEQLGGSDIRKREKKNKETKRKEVEQNKDKKLNHIPEKDDAKEGIRTKRRKQ